MHKKTTLILASLCGMMLLSACENTWRGMGRDVENTGETMQRSVND